MHRKQLLNWAASTKVFVCFSTLSCQRHLITPISFCFFFFLISWLSPCHDFSSIFISILLSFSQHPVLVLSRYIHHGWLALQTNHLQIYLSPPSSSSSNSTFLLGKHPSFLLRTSCSSFVLIYSSWLTGLTNESSTDLFIPTSSSSSSSSNSTFLLGKHPYCPFSSSPSF